MKKNILALLMLISISAHSQKIKDVRFSFGVNQSKYNPTDLKTNFLPDGSEIRDYQISSDAKTGLNGSITGALKLSKDGKLNLRTGLNFQSLRFKTLLDANSSGDVSRYIWDYTLYQLDLPLLISYQADGEKFSFGGDFGVIKALAVFGEIYTASIQLKENGEIIATEGIPAKVNDLVGLGEKYSAMFAPFVRYKVSESIRIELQPYFRHQFKSQSSNLNETNPSMSQFGLNLGIVKQF